MADTKISAMVAATTLATTNTFPIVQAGANKQATLGQVINLIAAQPPVTSFSAGNAISTQSDIVSISAACTLPDVSMQGKKIVLVSSGSGSVTFTSVTGTTTYSFVNPGSTITLLWFNSAWYVITVFNMTLV